MQLWAVAGTELSKIADLVGPFSGHKLKWDFEFSRDDKYVVFYSPWHEGVYLVDIGRAAQDPVAVSLKNGNNTVLDLDFSPGGDSIYVCNSNKPGFNAIEASQLNLKIFSLQHPDDPPTEIFRGPTDHWYSYFSNDHYDHYILVSDKRIQVFTTKLEELKDNLVKAINRNFKSTEWNGISAGGKYTTVIDSLPIDFTQCISLILNYSELLKLGDTIPAVNLATSLYKLGRSSGDQELCDLLAKIFCNRTENYRWSIDMANRAIQLDPSSAPSYKEIRAHAYWCLKRFDHAADDLTDYIKWYRQRYDGDLDNQYLESLGSDLEKIKAKQLPDL